MAVINGTSAAESLNGTAASDTIAGAGGADTITMLGGNDLALWSLGDGSDAVEGGTGTDTARFSAIRVEAGQDNNAIPLIGGTAGATMTNLIDRRVQEREVAMGRGEGRDRRAAAVLHARTGKTRALGTYRGALRPGWSPSQRSMNSRTSLAAGVSQL